MVTAVLQRVDVPDIEQNGHRSIVVESELAYTPIEKLREYENRLLLIRYLVHPDNVMTISGKLRIICCGEIQSIAIYNELDGTKPNQLNRIDPSALVDVYEATGPNPNLIYRNPISYRHHLAKINNGKADPYGLF